MTIFLLMLVLLVLVALMTLVGWSMTTHPFWLVFHLCCGTLSLIAWAIWAVLKGIGDAIGDAVAAGD